MPGPAPKSKSLRRHRHVPRSGEWIELPAEPFGGERPSLRGLPTDGPLSQFARDAWERWWSSPMAHQWTEGDWPELLRLLLLTDTFAKAARKGSTRDMPLGEMRQLEDRLGLNEAGRIKLRWLLPGGVDAGPSQPVKRRSRSSSAMRERLSVVDGG